MITRVVRMSFRAEMVPAFLETFKKAEDRIRHFEGCVSLKLVRDEDHENIYSTVSVWQNAAALEKYRQSELFKTTWQAAKEGFADKPVAFSLQGDIRE